MTERSIQELEKDIAALRESEMKFRAVFETMIEACCIFEMIYDDLGTPVDWRILEANAGYEAQSGLKDVAGKLASEVMPGTEPYWIETFARVLGTGNAEQIEKWHQPTGRWIHSSTARVGGSESRRLVSVFYDITERKRAEIALRESEQHSRILLAELQHRVRNTLAVVRSIASRTADRSRSAEEMFSDFQGRLNAFSRVQAALTRSADGHVDLKSLIEDELVVYAANETRVEIKGPEVILRPKAAECLSLAIHELTTNAVKHGALKGAVGKVGVGWSCRPNANGPDELTLSWKESGVRLNNRQLSRQGGFGMELLKRSLPYELDARIGLDLEPDGLRFELRMPFKA